MQVCHDYFHKNSGRVITKFNFYLLFSQAWLKSLVPGNIIAGFKKCGVYPYDPNAIVFPGKAKKKKQQPRVDETGSTMSQSDKDSDTNEDEDGGGGCGGGDGSNDGGCDKDKDGSARDEHGDNRMFADNRHENSALFDQNQLELYERRFLEGYHLFVDSDYVNWLQLYHPEALPPDSDLSLNEIFSSIAPETPLAIVDPQQKSDSISVTHKSDLTVTTPTVSEISTS